MQQPEGLSVLLPVFNQAGTLQQVLSAWSGFLRSLDRPYEIVLIDDGSTDSTPQLINGVEGKMALVQSVPHLRAVRLPERQGFGAAIKTGLEIARHPLVFYTGCDDAYNPVDLRKLLKSIEHTDPYTGKKIDIVNGYRAGTPLKGWRRHLGRCKRVFMSVVFGFSVPARPGWLGAKAHRYAFLMRAIFGLRIVDVNSKFKLFRKKIFEHIPIQSQGDFVHAEILAKANFLGCLMDETPIAERPGPFSGHPEPASPVSLGKELRRIFFHPDFGPMKVPPKESVAASNEAPKAAEAATSPSKSEQPTTEPARSAE